MQQFRKIIFHIGPDKTGSTSIQKTLAENKVLLLDESFLYPDANACRHHQVASYFSDKPEEFIYNRNRGYKNLSEIKNRDQTYMKSLDDELRSTTADVVVFSYEGFINLKKSELRKLHDYFKPFTESMDIFMYARDPYSYAHSAMSQRVKMGKQAWSEGGQVILYRSLVEKFQSIFGEDSIQINVFDKSKMKGQNVVVDFLSSIGVSNNTLSKLVQHNFRENKALSFEGVLVGERIIQLLLSQPLSVKEFREKITPHLEKIPGQKITLTDTQVKQIGETAQREISFLERTFDIQFPRHSFAQVKPLVSQNDINIMALQILKKALPDYSEPSYLSRLNSFKNSKIDSIRLFMKKLC